MARSSVVSWSDATHQALNDGSAHQGVYMYCFCRHRVPCYTEAVKLGKHPDAGPLALSKS